MGWMDGEGLVHDENTDRIKSNAKAKEERGSRRNSKELRGSRERVPFTEKQREAAVLSGGTGESRDCRAIKGIARTGDDNENENARHAREDNTELKSAG